jgi:hypothetical protein
MESVSTGGLSGVEGVGWLAAWDFPVELAPGLAAGLAGAGASVL